MANQEIKKIGVLIADDHPMVRRGIIQTLSETTDIEVIGEATTGEEVLKLLPDFNVDVILLDILMPDKNGLEILKMIKSQTACPPVLILTIYAEEQYAVRFLKAGASGYLTKSGPPEQMVTAIRKIAKGEKYITSTLAERLASYLEPGSEKPPHDSLSGREFQVMCLLGAGKTVSEISHDLNLSVTTVSTYRSRILDKMKMKNNAQLIHYALKKELIE